MAHSASSVTTSGSHSRSSDGSTTGFRVYGSLFKVSSRYQFLNPLGKGSYGVVCAAKDRDTGQCVAIKKVTPMAKRTVDAKHTLREVLLLQLLGKHPNVISIHNLSANVKDDELYIVMDLMDTDMHRVIQSSQPLSDSHAKYFLHQLLRGVKYLHDNGVLHRDLKPGNLLLSKTCQLKIADFGLARKIPRGPVASSNTLERPRSAPAASTTLAGTRAPERPPMTEHVVTRWYRAPELMLQPDGLYDQSVDMWSVGCIFAELLGRKALFPGKNFLHQLSLIFDVLGAPAPDATRRIQSSQAQRFLQSLGKKPKVPFRSIFPSASDSALDLLDRLLEFDPVKRISAQDALAHPYLQEMERKYNHRHGDGDPPPPIRADFSFDLKNLTKMDLRALIVKEVDSQRSSRSSSAATDTGTTGDGRGDLPAVEKPRSELTRSGSGVGIGKLHANLRHAQEQSQQHEKSTEFTPRQAPGVTLGCNRQRIRPVSKPPVPKQQEANGWVSNQQEHVRVVAAQATLLFGSLASRGSPPPEEPDARLHSTGEVLSGPPCPSSKAEGSSSYARTSFSARAVLSQPARHGSVPVAGDPGAAAIALSKRSKALIASLARSAKTPEAGRASIIDSASSRQPQAWQTKPSRNPESSSSSSASSPASPPREEVHNKDVCTGVSRTNRPGSAMLLTKRKKTRPEERTSAAIAVGRPRRVSSAGPTRSKPVATGSYTARPNNTYVGSINSLIRAQRSNTGQSLAESAATMLAAMTPSEPHESSGSREETGGHLKSQRSTSQLPGVDRKHPAKKLTVPKSPKFSVMSWQKKRESKIGGHSSGIAR